MSKVSLNPVRYYDITDIYTASVDNRPLRDISSNIDLLNSAVQSLGFYQEIYASPDVEPPGGFSPYTCAAVSKSNLLIPIDISLSPFVVDYAILPIYLVIESLGNSFYKCVSFTPSITLPSGIASFLNESIGKALKVGPGGSLVDEVYFDIYFGGLPYQSINVGKVLTQSTFSFGGNQVNTLADNRFLAKNRNDSSTGLITRFIDLQDSHTAMLSSILPESIAPSNSSYLFTSYINSVGGGTLVAKESPSPVYFSYDKLPLDNTTGLFTTNVLPLLNEIHFASPQITATTEGGTVTDSNLASAGVNVDNLLKFASSYLLHAPDYASSLLEVDQDLNTSLSLTNATGSINIIDTPYTDAPASLDSIFSIDSVLLSDIRSGSNRSGVTFGSFLTSTKASYPTFGGDSAGAYLGMASGFSTTPDVVSTFDPKGPTDFKSGNVLVLYSQKAATSTAAGAASLYLLSDGYLILGAPNGVFYKNVPVLDYEVSNKAYVDATVNALADSAKNKVPYTGTSSDTPITGSLYFDVTSSASPNVGLIFNTLISTEFRSNNAYEFRAASGSALQTVRGLTLPDIDGGSQASDFTTRSYVTSAISALSGAALSGYATLGTAQVFSASKSFNGTSGTHTSVTIDVYSALTIKTPDLVKANTSTIYVDTNDYISFKDSSEQYVKIVSKPTEDTDAANTVVTKDYASGLATAAVTAQFNDTAIYAIWGNHSVPTTTTTFAGYSGWRCLTQGTYINKSLSYISKFTENVDGSLTYTGTTPGLFMVTCSDARNSNKGPDFGGGVFRAQTAILVKLSGGSTVVQYAYNIHQDDTDGNSVNSLVAASCSAMVVLHAGDTLGIVSEWCETGSASLALIRYV